MRRAPGGLHRHWGGTCRVGVGGALRRLRDGSGAVMMRLGCMPAVDGRSDMIIADCGTTWAKILDIDTGSLEIVQTKELVKRPRVVFDIATGHSGRTRCREYRNELIALAEGGLSLVDEDDFSIVDVGGRDIKYVQFENRKIKKLDWNLACGATTGATVELLGGYYEIDFNALPPAESWVAVTCGVFGMERVLEQISMGVSAEESVAMFIHGIVRNVFDFVGRPPHLYLSGGFCENSCFVATLTRYCSITPLGRTVPLEGLRAGLPDGPDGSRTGDS